MNKEYIFALLEGRESYDLELKSAVASYSLAKLHDYCAAISNEDGGYLLLGINNDRQIIGTNAFPENWNELAHILTQDLSIRIKVHEVMCDDYRVLAFEIPRHITGSPTQVQGGTGKYRYPIRNGESLDEMDQQTLQLIFAERDEDWSAHIAEGVDIHELDRTALEIFRSDWARHTNQPKRLLTPLPEMLSDLQLVEGTRVTNAAVLLFGTTQLLSRVIPDAEIIFEWRNNEHDIAYGERRNWREGFMLIKDSIWEAVNARNTVFRYQEGFTQRDIPAFDESSIREAIVNAFAHRDYRITGRSIVIKVSPGKFYIENPGRLMPGVTLENILDKSVWRNRLLAESLERVHVMERSSQGMDKIFRHTIEAGKGLPVITLSPDPSVSLDIPAALKDQSFVNFLEVIVNKHQITLSIREIIELEQIRQGVKTTNLAYRDKFLDAGIIERVGQGRGSKYILSHQYYTYTNDPVSHTKLAGLPREVKRNIIMEHLKKNQRVTNGELQKALTDMGAQEITTLLKGMKKDGLIAHEGSPRWGFWRLDKSDKRSDSAS